MMRILKVSIFAVLFVIIVAISLYVYMASFDWEQKSSSASPDGKFTIYEYLNRADFDRHAPYGTYLFLKPTRSRIPTYKSYVIFAGYCSKKISYSWLSNNQVTIICEADELNDIRTLSKNAYGISINFNTKNS